MAEKLAKKQVQDLAVIDFEQDAGGGMEGADKESFAIPFLGLLQANSPQIVDDLIPNAKPGQFFNSVTSELWNKEVEVIPVAFARRFLEWAPRESGGGFRGAHAVSEVEAQMAKGLINRSEERAGVLVNKAGNNIRDTRHHYVLVKNADGVWDQAVISMASTQIKRSKKWMTLMNHFQMKKKDGSFYTPPSYARTFMANSEKESNEKGTWFSWNVKPKDLVDDVAVYNAARRFNDLIKQDNIKVDYSTLTEDEGASDSEGKF